MVDSPVALRNTLRRLADWPPDPTGVVTAYLDPHSTDNPNVRTGLIVLRDRRREIERGLERPARERFTEQVERIEQEVEQRLPDVHGLALFAAADGRFEAAETRLPLDNAVTLSRQPQLLSLARLADAEQAVVALVDTNTLRLFVHRSGSLEEIGLVDDQTDDYRQTAVGGWSQARFQRHVEAHREAFAKLGAEAIEQVVGLEEAKVLLLAGDEVAVPLLLEELPRRLAEMVRGTLRLGKRSTPEEVAAEALPALDRLREEDAADAAERLVGAALADAMAVVGVDATRRALTIGQALEVVIDLGVLADRGKVNAEPRDGDETAIEELEELVRLAAATDARVRFSADHAGLREHGGAGALLRFRLDRAADEAAGDGEAAPAVPVTSGRPS
ncbi:MAG: hypothetical protein M3N29_01245 [Chloroflexota bacterium]|nr:hypothetical protein [Chloroflexota bacterium]